jgi:coenzyme F420-0:L-glutamate ligase/coenzyme F420-1:gamma-L-glutamate ligase
MVEVILRESRRIVRATRNAFIVQTKQGFVCANAGIDTSNIPKNDVISLLPKDPDASARKLALCLRRKTGKQIAVIISDTFGRPWRLGLTDVAIGAAGLRTLTDLRGRRDGVGKVLNATVIAAADQLAAAAGILMEKDAGRPVVVIRGFRCGNARDGAARMIRPAREDLFR